MWLTPSWLCMKKINTVIYRETSIILKNTVIYIFDFMIYCPALTHREHTPRIVGSHLCCGARGAVWVRCFAQGHLSRGIEVERALYIHSPAPNNSCRPETRTRNLWITSPTL